ncbi:MAG: ATPase P [Pseudomonadota bacterium]
MVEVSIPGFGQVTLRHLVMDYNGTLALDGSLLSGVRERITALAERMTVHVITADTFGLVTSQLAGLPASIVILAQGAQDRAKQDYVASLNPDQCVCIGNGRNDALMLESARIGIALLQDEGASPAAVSRADILCRDILTAMDLLTHPKRLIATLRT